MADEEPKGAAQEDWGTDDDFALHLGWADARERGPTPGSVEVVDQWGTTWGGTTSDDADRQGSRPPGAAASDGDQQELHDAGVRLVELLSEVAELLEPVRSELGALRADLVALKRRTPLRADQGAGRSAEEAEQIARLVAEHLAALPSKRSRGR